MITIFFRVTTSASYVIKSALDKILDGYLSQFFNLPIFKKISKKMDNFLSKMKKNKHNHNHNHDHNILDNIIFKKKDHDLTKRRIRYGILVFLSLRLLSPLSAKIKTNPIKIENEKEGENIPVLIDNKKDNFFFKFLRDLKKSIFEKIFTGDKPRPNIGEPRCPLRFLLEDEK